VKSFSISLIEADKRSSTIPKKWHHFLLLQPTQLIGISQKTLSFKKVREEPVISVVMMDIKNFFFFSCIVNGHIESKYHKATGQWTPLKFVSDPRMHIHGLAPGLNYGQQALEGLKVFRMSGESGGIAVFRPDQNAARFQHSARMLNMPAVPIDLFVQACRAAVALNAEYVPPHESGWSMYCRPLLFSSAPMFPPGVPDECTFCVYVFPTTEGIETHSRAVKALILDEFDRAAPKGMGHAKTGGNYGGVLRWGAMASAEGFGVTLHLDSARHEQIDEFSLCGFLGVKEETSGSDTGITIVKPESPATINSVTSDSVQQIARSWGWTVDKRPVAYRELPLFSEVLGAGTALGLIPIQSITRRGITDHLPSSPRLVAKSDNSEVVMYIPEGQQEGGPIFQKLFKQLKGVQYGRLPDDFGWRFMVQASDGEIEKET
jgi:branched-chain amino acid aminotransferase